MLCFGTWRFGETSGGTVKTTREEVHELLTIAADNGINFFDTANTYGDPLGTNEEYLGEWLADRDWEESVIANKVGLPVGDGVNDDGPSRRHIRQQVEASLEHLGTDHIDLYYVHRLDERTPVEETLSALVEDRTVMYLGASTMAAWQLATLDLTAEANEWTGFDVTQPPIDVTLNNWKRYEESVLTRYLEMCADQGLGVVPYSPLAGGFLTVKSAWEDDDPTEIVGAERFRGELLPDLFDRNYLSESAWDVLGEIEAIASELNATPAQVAIRWLIDQNVPSVGTVVPIVGVCTPEQLTENAGAVEVDLDQGHRSASTTHAVNRSRQAIWLALAALMRLARRTKQGGPQPGESFVMQNYLSGPIFHRRSGGH